MIRLGPVGPVSRGHVLDVNVKPFERALKFYDPYLYVTWNPTKLKRHGCWEIRRKPETMSVIDIVEFEGNTIVQIGYPENDLVAHVLDCAFLNYDQLRKIKDMDTWVHYGERGRRFAAEVDDKAIAYAEVKRKQAKDDAKYAIKQTKSQIKAFKDYVLSGNNPTQIADYWQK